MKLTNPLRKTSKLLTAMPGKELGADSEKSVLPKGTLIEHKGRTWELSQSVEVTEK